jgi:LysM repeat protein
MDKRGRLKVAQQVLVPIGGTKHAPVQVAQSVAPATDAARESPPASPSTPARWYTVRAGDTLFGIAHRFGTAVDALLHVNKLPTASIQPGLKLRIPG